MDAAYGEGYWRAMRRFGILQNGKIRACDNARRALHNAATRRVERMACESPDFPARVAAAFHRAQRRPQSKWASRDALEMLSGTDDLADAYRHCPTNTPQYCVFALWRPADPAAGGADLEAGSGGEAVPWPGGVVYFTLPGFNFGLSAAVPQFNRFPELMQAVARRLFGVCACHFFDDFNVTEPAFSAASGQWALRQLLAIVGFPFAGAKAVDVDSVVVFLGVESDFSELVSRGVVRMRVRPDRVQRLVARCEEVLAEGILPSSVAASLVGKLQFTLSWSFGRFGRGALQPLHRRRTGAEGDDGDCLDAAIAQALRFVVSVLPTLPPHEFSVDDDASPPVLLWTDGSYEPELADGGANDEPGRTGFLVAVPRPGARAWDPAWGKITRAQAVERLAEHYDFYHSSAVVPAYFIEGLVEGRHYIGQVEILAAILPYVSAPELFRGKRVLHWIDNTAALSAMMRGYSRSPDYARLVHAFHAFNVGLGARVYFEYVRSKGNVADEPSRIDLTHEVYDFFESSPRLRSVNSIESVMPERRRWYEAAGEWAAAGERRRAAVARGEGVPAW